MAYPLSSYTCYAGREPFKKGRGPHGFILTVMGNCKTVSARANSGSTSISSQGLFERGVSERAVHYSTRDGERERAWSSPLLLERGRTLRIIEK